MTAITDDTLTPDGAQAPDVTPNVHDSMAAARLAGYSWDEINGHLGQATDTALAAGYGQDEVDAHLGYQNPGPLKTYLNSLPGDEKAPLPPLPEPSADGNVDNPEQPDERLQAAYAEAVQSGQVKGPADFADHVAEATGSSPDAAKLLASMLPSVEDTTDRAIAIVHQDGNDLTPEAVATARDNLMGLYGRSGITPEEVQQTTDPVLHEVIATPQEPGAPTAEEVDKFQKSFTDPEGASINTLTLKQLWNGLDISKALGMPSFLEQESSFLERQKEIRDNPGMYDANARLHAALEDPMLWVYGAGTIGKGVGVPRGPAGLTRMVDAIDRLITDKDGNVEKVERGTPGDLITAQMDTTVEEAKASTVVWKDGRYQAIRTPADLDAKARARAEAKEPGLPGAKQADLGLERPTQPQDIADAEARAKTEGKELGLDGTREQPLSLERPVQPQDIADAIARARAEAKEPGLEGAKQSTLTMGKPVQPAEVRAQDAFDKEMAQRRAEGKGGATELERPVQPQDIRDAEARARAEAVEPGLENAKEGNLGLERPVQPQDIKDALAREKAEALEHPGMSHALQTLIDLDRPIQPQDIHDAAARAKAEAKAPPMPARPVEDPEQAAAIKAQIKEQADRVGIAPRKEPEPELAPPPELSRGDKNAINTDLDDELHRMDGRHEANIWRGQKATKALPPEWQDPKFREKVHDSLEKRSVDPTHEHAPDVKAFLDATKDWADRRTELAREHARLTGQDPKLVKTAEEGFAPRVKAEDAKPLVPGDPDFERDPITGGNGRGFTKTVTSTLEQKEYVLHNPETGERIWGGTDVKKSGLEFGQKVPADLLNGRAEMEVKPATTKEIDANTGSKHSADYWANLVNDVTDLDRANNHIKFLKNQMKELEAAGLWTKDKDKASGKKEVLAPQIKGYADPKIADTLNAFHNQSATARGPIGQLVDFLGKASRYLMRTLFISPAMHALNVGAHWGIGRGLDWFHPMGYWRLASTSAQAVRNVWGLREPYINEIQNGAGHQYLSTQTRNFYRTLTMKSIHDVVQNPTQWQGYLKMLGMPAYNAIDLANAMYRWSGKSLWFMNDVFLHQRSLELQQSGTGAQRFLGEKLAGAVGAKTGGMDIREAIFRAEKDIPNYRIPSQVLGSAAMAQFMKSPIFMNFGRYRYGQMRALALNVKDLIAPEGGLTASKGFGIEDRLDAVAKLTLLYVGAQYGYPLINSAMQQAASAATGGADWAKNLVLRAAGPFSLLHAVGAVKGFSQQQKAYGAAVASFMTWGKALEIGQMVSSNRDSFTGKPVIDPKASPLGKAAQGIETVGKEIYPLGQALNLAKPGGLPKTLSGFLGGDVEKPVSQSDQAKFDKYAQAQANSRERKDPFEGWLKDTLENYGLHPGGPPAAGGGSSGSGNSSRAGGGSGSQGWSGGGGRSAGSGFAGDSGIVARPSGRAAPRQPQQVAADQGGFAPDTTVGNGIAIGGGRTVSTSRGSGRSRAAYYAARRRR